MKSVRIGAGAGFAGDRIDPAVELARAGRLDFLVFECLAERTTALSQLRKREDPEAGYDPLLADRMRAVLPACRQHGTRIVGNMGAANPRAAAQATLAVARSLGLRGLKIAYVEGDDVLALQEHFRPFDEQPLPHAGMYFSANAYLGADTVADALDRGADIVITGRVADPSLYLGTLLHAFHWDTSDWERLGQGIVVGHLLECAGQLTGGYFADPGYKEVPDIHHIGFPFADVGEDGSALFSKLEDSGGLLNFQTCREQLLYEVLDPSSYMTPDVIADFTEVKLLQEGPNRVRVSGGRGRRRPEDYKVSVGINEGLIAEGQISYAGQGALARAELARNILQKRLSSAQTQELRFDLIGLNAIYSSPLTEDRLHEVRLRVAGRFADDASARRLTREVESLYLNGPAGGSGVTFSIRESIAIVPALLKRDLVSIHIHMEEA